MDEQVLAAMARWPNVPDVYGWLSLSARGIWHLHPDGHGWDASGLRNADDSATGASTPDPVGEPITSPQIAAFIGRNYASAPNGQWYFQNGPQRVYVRLDAAPWILHTEQAPQGAPGLATHAGPPYGPVTHWWFDEAGRLFAQAGQGAGMIEGRDLPPLLERLRVEGKPLIRILEEGHWDEWLRSNRLHPSLDGAAPVPLGLLPAGREADRLGFVPKPRPDAKIPA